MTTDRCDMGHKVCTWCLGCMCDGGARVSTDRLDRTLCAACRAIDNHNAAPNAEVRTALQPLDGTRTAAVSLLTGFSRAELDDLGGITE